MPVYNFATYVDTREEWVIRADTLDEARKRIADDPNGDWLNDATLIDTEAVECRIDFVIDIGTDEPAITEVTPDHPYWRAAHRDYAEYALGQNIAAISAEIHTHHLYGRFYERFGKEIDGFVGVYELCVTMARELTDWELANGLGEAYENVGSLWIEVVEDFVQFMLATSLQSGELPEPADVLPRLQSIAKQSSPEAVIQRIARDRLGIDTFDARNLDEYDFHNLSVWAIREALLAAYGAGAGAVACEASTTTSPDREGRASS